jgi:hypothetical protein
MLCNIPPFDQIFRDLYIIDLFLLSIVDFIERKIPNSVQITKTKT